jgi:hypothetical protein
MEADLAGLSTAALSNPIGERDFISLKSLGKDRDLSLWMQAAMK